MLGKNSGEIKKLKGPILIFGAGGFIGINLMIALSKVRSDVIGVSQNPRSSYRIKQSGLSQSLFRMCDLRKKQSIQRIIDAVRPKTIYNLAAYGAYPFQKSVSQIYETNFLSTITLLDILSRHPFHAYIHGGSQSEYGLNATKPKENDLLVPNSHYAVSKAAVAMLLAYYGKVKQLPIVHVRLYSIYGPFEESTRLIPTLIRYAKQGIFPKLVDASISRDFVHVADTVCALIQLGVYMCKDFHGEVFNIATGRKTTIQELATIAQKLFHIQEIPQFGSMKERDWDVVNWVGNSEKLQKMTSWRPKISLEQGLQKLFDIYEE